MADDEKGTTLFLPDGRGHRVGVQKHERVELRPGVGEWLRQFADVAAALKLGLHCGQCGQDLTGINNDTDHYYAVACSCREFVWDNIHRRPDASLRMQ